MAAPVNSPGFPIVSLITNTDVSVKAKTNENGNGYLVVDIASASAPTPTEVKAGQASGGGSPVGSTSGIMVTDTEFVLSITGLTQSTDYIWYFIAEDDTP